VVDCWHQAFGQRTGVRPAWGKRELGQLKRVLEKAGGDHAEVRRRIGILFTSPPAFLARSPPDIATLEQHWDKLAAPSGGGNGFTRTVPAQSMAQAAAEQLARERAARGGT
jgi:hypothetical protein